MTFFSGSKCSTDGTYNLLFFENIKLKIKKDLRPTFLCMRLVGSINVLANILILSMYRNYNLFPSGTYTFFK